MGKSCHQAVWGRQACELCRVGRGQGRKQCWMIAARSAVVERLNRSGTHGVRLSPVAISRITCALHVCGCLLEWSVRYSVFPTKFN